MSFELIMALESLLKDGFAQTVFRVPEKEPGDYVPPKFFIGALPARRKGNDPEFEDLTGYPFIINRFWEGEDLADDATLTLQTVCGVYTAGDKAAGEQDIFNMMARCRRLMMEKRILEGRFELDFPLKWRFGDTDDRHLAPHPFYGGFLLSRWRVPGIDRQLSPAEEVRIYGAGYQESGN